MTKILPGAGGIYLWSNILITRLGEQLAIVPHCTTLRGATYTSPNGLLTQGTAGLAGWIPRSSMHHAQESGNLQAKLDNAKQDHSAKSHQSWLNIVPHVLQFQVWNIRYSRTGINYVLWIKNKTPKLLLVVLNITRTILEAISYHMEWMMFTPP